MPINSDIAANDTDAAYLRQQYPTIANVLYWPELVAEFQKREAVAKEKKGISRKDATWAVGLFVLSTTLLQLAGSPLVDSAARLPGTLVAVSALFLLFAVILGKGLLFGRRKAAWLRERLCAERLRQLHFQFLLFHADKVVSARRMDQDALIADRSRTLGAVVRRLDDDGYIKKVRDDSGLEESDLLETRQASFGDVDPLAHSEFTRYWTESRFEWQAGYANSQLVEAPTSFALRGSLADRNRATETIEWIFTVLIAFLQLSAIGAQIVLFIRSTLFSSSDTQLFALFTQGILLLISIFAVLSVGLQSYRDGLSLPSDVGRNRVYASYTTKLLRKFRDVVDEADLKGQLRVMREMEDLAYFEMREFLIQHSKSRFSV